MTQQIVYIGIGSNLGSRKENIDKAVKMLSDTEQIEFCRKSDIIETAPLGKKTQPDYLNAVAEIKTFLKPEDLLGKLRDIENMLGRKREEKWSSRTIDLDILLFGDQVIHSDNLTVPHSQMHLRSFVLNGLCRLNSELVHPVMKVSVTELASRLNNCDFTLNPDVPQLISIAGNIGVGKTTLAKKLSEYFSCEVSFEPYDDNPFLPEVYAGRKDLSLDSQLFFLTKRVEQLGLKNLIPNRIYMSDYVFDKEQIYAEVLLDSKQLALYEEIYNSLAQKVFPPVLVIYMYDSSGNCLNRIHNRNRPYEQRIELEFLDELNEGYKHLFENWKISPVIRISTQELDYSNQGKIIELFEQISFYITVSK